MVKKQTSRNISGSDYILIVVGVLCLIVISVWWKKEIGEMNVFPVAFTLIYGIVLSLVSWISTKGNRRSLFSLSIAAVGSFFLLAGILIISSFFRAGEPGSLLPSLLRRLLQSIPFILSLVVTITLLKHTLHINWQKSLIVGLLAFLGSLLLGFLLFAFLFGG